MDRALHGHTPGRADASPRPELITLYWRMLGPSRQPLVCGLYRTHTFLEVSAGYEADYVVRSQRVNSEAAAAAIATQWRTAMLAIGTFVDLDAPASGTL
jgi:hypothetical protein